MIPFSSAEAYVHSLLSKGEPVRIILDTNILIAASYEVKESYDKVKSLLKSLENLDADFFATVNTKPSSWIFIDVLCWQKRF